MEFWLLLQVMLSVTGVVVAQGNLFTLESLRENRWRRHTPLDSSQICKVFGCKNGHCKESELRNFRIVCECFPGYEGTLCDRLKCPYDCGTHGTCSRVGNIMFCKCDEGYSGTTCNTLNTTPLISPQSILTVLDNLIKGRQSNVFSQNQRAVARTDESSWFSHRAKTAPNVRFTDFLSHAEIDTNVKPDVCAPGFQCYHGKCDRDSMTYGRFQCKCNTDFTGLFCEKRCTLKCQNGGTCMVLEDGHQYCACPFNLTGVYCQVTKATPRW